MSRLFVITIGKRKEKRMMNILSDIFVFLAIIVCGLTYLSIVEVRYPINNKIIVIGQAAYAFTLIGFAIYNIIISNKRKDNQMFMIKNISLVAAIGSIMSLERTMLGTFGSVNDIFNRQMEAGTGALFFLIILLIAYSIRRKCKH